MSPPFLQDPLAGIIPRSLHHLFEELEKQKVQEFSVRVSFLELYNEELFDLLSVTEDNSKLRIFEDASRKVLHRLILLHCLKLHIAGYSVLQLRVCYLTVK